MTWKKRESAYRDFYGYSVGERTMRNWCKRLIELDVIAKDGSPTRWKTRFDGDRKIQEPITEDEEAEMQRYFERRAELYKDYYISELERNVPPKEASKAAWKQTYSELWAEFGCCYYYCKRFVLTAFSNSGVDV